MSARATGPALCALWVAASLTGACSGDSGESGTDAAAPPDGGATRDAAGPQDAGARRDAGADARVPDAGRACTGAPYPIVLSHGFSGFESIGPLNYYFRVADDLRGRGEAVIEAVVSPYQSSDVRGRELGVVVDDTLRSTGACKVVIVAHSQGGIDVRTMIGSLGYGDRVAAVVTIATPHRGTKVADAVLGLVPGAPDVLLDFFALVVGRTISGAGDDPALRASLESLSIANMTGAFLARNPDDPRVAFYSVAGRSDLQRGDAVCAGGIWPNSSRVDAVDPLLFATSQYLRESLTDPVVNDGLVTVESAKWGPFLGCVPADHMDEVGQIADLVPDLTSGWDHVQFYRDLVAFLHDEGF